MASLLNPLYDMYNSVANTLFGTPEGDDVIQIYGNAEKAPLTHIGADGAFYIHGVRYNIDPNGYIGGGSFGVVWLAQRDPTAKKFDFDPNAGRTYDSLVERHYADFVYKLLNAPECCVKLVQVERSTATRGEDYKRELELQSEAGRFVQGVLAILAATPPPADGVGPVTIDPKWIEKRNPPGSGRLKKGGPCEGSHWAVIAVELADKGNLRKWTNPLSKDGDGQMTIIENEEERLRSLYTAQQQGLQEVAIENAANFAGKESVFGGVDGSGNEDLARGVLFRLLKYVQKLHRRNILHLDIKPDNITINHLWDLCIIDFGLARKMDDPALRGPHGRQSGTAGFRAPDDILPDEKTDIFAIGMTLCCMLLSSDIVFAQGAGRNNQNDQFYDTYLAQETSLGLKKWAAQLQGWYSHPKYKYYPYRPRVRTECISDKGARLCHRMVLRDRRLRPTITECLADPWFQEGNLIRDNGEEWQKLVRQSLANTGHEGRSYWLQNHAGVETQKFLAEEE